MNDETNEITRREMIARSAFIAATSLFSPASQALGPFVQRMKKRNRPPVWSSPASGTLGSYLLGENFSQTFVATDPEGTAVTYATASGAFPNNLALTSSSGVLAGAISGDNPPTWTSPAAGSLGTFHLGASVSQTLTMTPFGATTIQTYRVCEGFLPHGVGLTYTAGSSTATLSGSIANRYFNGLSYVPNPDAPTWNTSAGSLASLTQTFAMSTVTVSATPVAPATMRDYTIVSGNLPVGISLNSQTGNITGTPQINIPTQQPIDDVLPKPTFNSPAAGTLETVRTGTAITSQTMTATANSPATSILGYHITSGFLPPGVSLNQTTGVLSGTPANDVLNEDTTFNFTVRARDNRWGYVDRAYSLVVQTWDANWASVVSCMRMNGTNGSTTISDDTGKAVTANGSAQLSNAQFKWGDTSLYLEGSTSYLSLANTTDWALPGDFTIELWVYPVNFTGGPALISSGAGATDWEFHLTAAGVPTWTVNNRTAVASSATLTANRWNYVAVTRATNTVRVYTGNTSGTAAGSISTSYTSQGLAIGRRQATAASYFNGYIEDVRITKGVARYTGATITKLPLQPPTRA